MKKIIKNIGFILIALLLISGCRTAKKINTSSHLETNRDSIFQKTEEHRETQKKDSVVIIPPVNNHVQIEHPCDSTGQLLPFLFDFGSNGNTGTLRSQNNMLVFDFKLDSIKSHYQMYYRNQYKKDSIQLSHQYQTQDQETETKTKVVWPWWLWLALIIAGISIIGNIFQKFKII